MHCRGRRERSAQATGQHKQPLFRPSRRAKSTILIRFSNMEIGPRVKSAKRSRLALLRSCRVLPAALFKHRDLAADAGARLSCVRMTIELPPLARCVQCGYLLRALVEPRCPECGHAFDPHDPKSYHLPPGSRPRRPWLPPLSPADLRHIIIVTVVAIVYTMLALPPYAYFEYADRELFVITLPLVLSAHLVRMRPWPARLVGGSALLVCIVLLPPFLRAWRDPHLLWWFALLLSIGGSLDLLWRGALTRRRLSPAPDHPPHRRRLRRLLLALIVLFYVNLLCPPAAPCTLRLWISVPFLSAKADAVLAAGKPELRPQWVGFWKVERIVVRPNGSVEFLTRPDDRHTTAVTYSSAAQASRPDPWSRVWPFWNWYFSVRSY